MKEINNLLKKCKTSKDIKIVMNNYLSDKKDRYSLQLKINLIKENKFDKLLQIVYNYLLNQEFPTKTNDTKEVRTKGTAIGGMECHSRY